MAENKEVPEKHFVTPNSLYNDSIALALKIRDSGFRPSFIVGLWRGGTPPGIIVHEILSFCNIEADHIPIRTARYDNSKTNEITSETVVDGLDYIVEKANKNDSLLFVDDVFDTGLTMRDVIEELKKRSRLNTPEDIRIATVYYKPKKNRTEIKPNFYIHETDKWIVFPHEFRGLTLEEISKGKGEYVGKLLRKNGVK